jgi:putative DNA primase/helicase
MLAWATRFGQEMFRATVEDKFRIFTQWADDVARAIKRGALTDDTGEIISEFVDKADRYFSEDTAFGSANPMVMAILAVIRQAANKHELNGHIAPVKTRKSEIHMDRAENVEMLHIDWLWKGHLAIGMLEMISGVPEMGKSQVQVDMCARVTNGWAWPDGTPGCTPSNVLMLAAEDSWTHVVVPRLCAAGADMSKVIYIRDIFDIKTQANQGFMIQEHCAALEEAVIANKVLLLTIDPITAFMGGKMDAHKATEVRDVLNPLKQLAERAKCAVSILTHPAKNASNKARDQFIGSQAFIALARIGHLVVEEVTKDGGIPRKLFTQAKNNIYARMPTLAYRFEQLTVGEHDGNPVVASHVVWDKDSVPISADEAVAAAAGTTVRTPDKTEAETFIREALEAGPVKVRDLEKMAKEAGIGWATVKNAKDKCRVIVKRHGMGKDGYWTWELPKADVLKFRVIDGEKEDDPE